MKTPIYTKLVFVLTAVAFIAVSVSQASAQDRPEPNTFMKEKMGKALLILGTAEKDTREAEMHTLVSDLIDYDNLAERSLGDHWAQRTPEEQTQYKALFSELVQLTYVQRMTGRKPDTKYDIEWDRDRVKGDLGYSNVFVLFEDTETELSFTLKAKDASWMLHDLAIDGASVEDTYRRNYGKIIDEEGFPALIEKMEKKIVELKG